MEDIVRLPQMSFSESVKTVLSKLTDFKGRARRSELWWFWLLYAVVSVVLNLSLAGMQVVSSVVSMLLLLSICSVTVRRLHDRGHGGWWVGCSKHHNKYIVQYIYVVNRISRGHDYGKS